MFSCKSITITILLIVIISIIINDVNCARRQSSSSSATRKLGMKKRFKSKGTVKERGLVSEKVTPRAIVKNHDKYYKKTLNKKLFKSKTLAYVTPWNSKGYDVAKLFTNKFDYISPVWFETVIIKVDEKNPNMTPRSVKFAIEGKHDVDNGWVSELQKNSKDVLIVPRIHFDKWNKLAFDALFKYDTLMRNLADMLARECRELNFDGFVIDIGYLETKEIKEDYYKMMKLIARKLHSAGKKMIITTPPLAGTKGRYFDKKDFDTLFDDIDHFQMMTYDYNGNAKQPLPNAPYNWVKDSLSMLLPTDEEKANKGHKVMIGMNMYGTEFSSTKEPILGDKYLEIMKSKDKPHEIAWLPTEIKEHAFTITQFGASHTIFYPTLLSIDVRLQLANEYNCGVALWEIGQGLDYFYDLF